MKDYCFKRIYGLIGAPGAGKSTIGYFLKEKYNFLPLAFADSIKEEYGISKDDFDVAKNFNETNKIRESLWKFSQQVKDKDPSYFINKVMKTADKHDGSVVVTDIRTKDELNAVLYYTGMVKIYFVVDPNKSNFDESGYISGSKLHRSDLSDLMKKGKLGYIVNDTVCGIDIAFEYYLRDFFESEEGIQNLID